MAFEPLADAPSASLSYSQCQTAQSSSFPGHSCLRVLLLPLLSFVAADPRARGLAERPETSSLVTCRAVTRDATLARHEPSRATGRHASRRSAVALSAQVPPPSPLPGPARRLHATSR